MYCAWLVDEIEAHIMMNRNECAGWHSPFLPCLVKLQPRAAFSVFYVY